MIEKPSSELPGGGAVVAERLEQSGVRFSHDQLGKRPLTELFSEGVFTREFMENYGFLLIDHYDVDLTTDGAMELYMGRTFSAHGDVVHKNQWFHTDGLGRFPPDVVTLRYMGQEPRNYATILTTKNDAFVRACLEFFAQMSAPSSLEAVNILCREGRSKLRGTEVLELGDDQFCWDSHTAPLSTTRDFLLHGAGTSGILVNQPFLPELYDYLEQRGLAYRHEWVPGQLLALLNNGPRSLLHARCPSRNRKPPEDPDPFHTDMWRQFLYWENGSLTTERPKL